MTITLDVRRLALEGLLLVTPKRFDDTRGFLSETYNARAFAQAGIAHNFVQDNHSRSAEAGTIRGLHFQVSPHAQTKLVRVARGRILDVTVDLRRGSPSFGQHLTVELSAENWSQILIPEGFAHGFCTLEPDTDVIYKATDFYAPECDGGILWNDPALAIKWPDCAGARISTKDTILPRLSEFESPFIFPS